MKVLINADNRPKKNLILIKLIKKDLAYMKI